MDDSSSWNYPNFKPNFLFNYNFQPFPNSPMDPKHPSHSEMMMTMGGAHHQFERSGECDVICGGDPKKKRLTSEQLESLESSFQEDIKLDPDRKMKLSRDLGLQPRQVAVWFQNRRARWKAKQLERLYDSLKCEFDIVSREKHALQDEVMKLRAMLMEQATRIQTLNHNHKQVSIGCTDQISGGDDTTVESTPATRAQPSGRVSPVGSIGAECHYMFNGNDYNTTVVSPPPPPYWPPLPSSYHPC